MNLLEEIKRLRELTEKANNAYGIDLYRTLNQPIEKRLPFENFIDESRTAIPTLCDALEQALDVLKIYSEPAYWDFGKARDGGSPARALLKEWGIE